MSESSAGDGAWREELPVDDQRSAWNPRGRLVRIEERLERLQKTVGKLNELLVRVKRESDQRTAQGAWNALGLSEWSTVPGRSDVSSVPGARPEGHKPAARPMSEPPCDRDPIGCVEIGVERLAEDIRRLFRVLGATPPDDGPWVLPPRYTGPTWPQQGPSSGDQTEGATGDDALNDLDPTKGPGGSGPYRKKPVKPDDEDPRFGPGF